MLVHSFCEPHELAKKKARGITFTIYEVLSEPRPTKNQYGSGFEYTLRVFSGAQPGVGGETTGKCVTWFRYTFAGWVPKEGEGFTDPNHNQAAFGAFCKRQEAGFQMNIRTMSDADVEDLAALYTARRAQVESVLRRIPEIRVPGTQHMSHTYGNVIDAVRKNLTPEERADWNANEKATEDLMEKY